MSLEPCLEDLMKRNGLYRTSMDARRRVGPLERNETAFESFLESAS